MTSNNTFPGDEDKPSLAIDQIVIHESSNYITNCQVCRWNGYPCEKIIIEFEGIRHEEEDGFVDIFTEYDYDPRAEVERAKHKHKYNPKLLQEYVDIALKIGNGG
jgi:hypothetical protein